MVDSYADAHLAELYDLINGWDRSDDFYLDLVMSAAPVLDVGCGTGALLRRAREAGHTGQLRGLDPAASMLDLARANPAIEWVQGDLSTVAWEQQFDLIVMTGHAFQVLLTEDDIRTTLVSARRALRPGGRFAFETRNPLVRGWEGWTPENAREVTTSDGALVRIEHRVQSVEGGVVEMSESFISERWDEPQVSYGSLRFLSADELSSYLDEAGLTIEAQFGDWDRSPFTATSPEIITITRN